MTVNNSVKIPFLLYTNQLHLTQQTCFLLLCLCQENSGIWNTFYHQQKLMIIQILRLFKYFDLINLLIVFHRMFSISVYNLYTNGRIVWNLFENISNYVAKYTTNERYQMKPSSLKSFLIRSYFRVFFRSRKPVVFGRKF